MPEIADPQIARPASFARFELKNKVCACGHDDLGHRIDKTCRTCLCIRFRLEETANA